ncbi:MAG TPA: ThiF family adenylyltransferase [Syntrophobacteraceae bacterium]|nr:ThiF family adenylyltransferase [Syntrophobacteraceae bacterium]
MEETLKGDNARDPDPRESLAERHLEELACLVDELGDSQLVIQDHDLLEWAKNHGISPRDAVVEVLRSRIVPLRYAGNVRALSLAEQRRVCESRVLVCGCGGVGGVLINLLARAGVGTLRLVDGAVFVPSHLNRQWHCDTRELSRPKAEAAGERARAANPLIKVEVFPVAMDEKNAESLVEGTDLVMDALDDLPARFVLAETAKSKKVPLIHTAAVGWWGQVSTFLPESIFDLRNVYGRGEEQSQSDEWMGALGPAPTVIGGLAAFEALRLLAGRNPAYADQLCYLDGESGRLDVIYLEP